MNCISRSNIHISSWKNVKALKGWWRILESPQDKLRPPDCLINSSQKHLVEPPCAFEKCLFEDACQGVDLKDRTLHSVESLGPSATSTHVNVLVVDANGPDATDTSKGSVLIT